MVITVEFRYPSCGRHTDTLNESGGRCSSSTSCCLCHRYVRKSVRKVGISNAKLCQGLLVVVRALLRFCGILDIRDTRRVKFCHRQNNVTVNILDTADTDWDSKYRIDKSLYARRLSFSYKVPQHLHYYFHIFFLLFRDDFYKYHNVDFIHIYQHFWRFNAILKCYIRSIYAFERFTFITQKQKVSKHRINPSIDIDTYLWNILIFSFSIL